MNQTFQQKAITDIEMHFHKFLNNSNFSYDCRNNIGKCFFVPIFDEIEKLRYVKNAITYSIQTSQGSYFRTFVRGNLGWL